MITLTANGAGTDSDSSVLIKSGRRYAFQWAKDSDANPTAGTLTPLQFWDAGLSATPSFLDSTGTPITYDLSTEDEGGFEFVATRDASFSLGMTGANENEKVHFNVALIKI